MITIYQNHYKHRTGYGGEGIVVDDPTETMKAAWRPMNCDCMPHVCMQQKGRQCQWPIDQPKS